MVKEGKSYSLSVARFPGMPLFPGHPPFQVVNYRTPPGIIAGNVEPWGPPNEVGLGYMAEYLMACSHSGAHIDALGHMTIGEDNHWYGGGNTAEHLTDHGPRVGDAEHLPPFFTRGVLLDPPGYRGVDALPASEPVSADELQAIADAQGVEVRPWDVVLIRTGYLKYWPDAEAMEAHKTAGPDLSAAEWLLERGVVATGTDTETYEVMPTPDRGSPANPQPVHTKLLIENGIYLLESLYLEDIARDKVYEFLFVMLPLKIRGATGSMVDPLAMI
ncbi:MAG: cyclase family protein [Actinobacteria bacterium]|nr:cyclase family protein [Actinomycetota bacterium]